MMMTDNVYYVVFICSLQWYATPKILLSVG